ncbi:B12-binding domain-containing radical SAM protein [Halobacteriovorax sp. HLS]|uniref:B12-binding domain-containing radical SAM protein n=1 Tax=Halobacteriovorax sp. HLS TaxID=2234000 RepID=UPI000FDA2696|nr:radical SAM protein [Halobacteriovorax sp. HLS]
MSENQRDIVFINPGNRKVTYQNLGDELCAIEPPFLTASFASFLRNNNYSVAIIDANAENLTPEETLTRIKEYSPKLCAVIVYGGQPSASTQTMNIAGEICSKIKEHTNYPVTIGGLHPSALPKRTLKEENVDYVIEGEEQESLLELMKYIDNKNKIEDVPGLWYYKNDVIRCNPKNPVIKDLDEALPIAAWDLLPMDKYRAHNWHCFDDIENRSPYAAIYTSLGCPYSCTFCCINAPFGKPGIRYRSPELVVEEIELLVKKYGVKNFKFIDEMFVLKESHYMKITDLLIEKDLDLNIWCYSRIDTVKTKHLARMKKAGFNWFCLGIESANDLVRDGASKRLRFNDIKEIVQSIRDAGIRVLSNFIVGLPDDDIKTMEETFQMAVDLNTEFMNLYSAMAYPGSKLYTEALENNQALPTTWSNYSQHAKDQLPLPTKHIGAMEVLKFRDEKWEEFFKGEQYLSMVKETFGDKALEHINFMTSKKLARNYER